MSFLKSPLFSVILVFLTIIIGLGAWFFPQNTEFKSLKISVLTSVNSVSVSSSIKKENLKIFYNENIVDNLGYLKLRLKNDGTIPVLPEDYVEELKLVFPDEIRILDLSVKPNQIITAQVSGSSAIVFGKKLLNPGDFIDMEVIIETDGEMVVSDSLKVTGRIVGVKSVILDKVDVEDLFSDEEKQQFARVGIFSVIKSVLVTVLFSIFFMTIFSFSEYKGDDRLFKKMSKISQFIMVVSAILAVIFLILPAVYQSIEIMLWAI